MRTILIVSTDNRAGKSLLSLGLGLTLRENGIPFSYMKPISSKVSYSTGEPLDRDAGTIRDVLGLDDPLKEIAPVALEGPFLQEAIESGDRGFHRRIVDAFARITAGRDVAIVEGRRYLGLGTGAGLSDLDLAELLGADLLLLTSYDGEEAIDRILCALRMLEGGPNVLGVVINEVAMESQFEQVRDVFVPFLADRGAEVLGIIPYERRLRWVQVDEIVERLGGKVLTDVPLELPVENFLVGAMGPEAALRSFRRTPNLGVITGGDRHDLQEAALTVPSLHCLVLTGNLRPPRRIIELANTRGVPIILVGQHTMSAALLCQELPERSRLRRGARLDEAIELVRKNVDLELILEKAEDR